MLKAIRPSSSGLVLMIMVLALVVVVSMVHAETSYVLKRTGSMAVGARARHTATLLTTGQVLVVGGKVETQFSTSAELYTPGTNRWEVTAPMTTPRFLHTATLLPDGRVLVAGGIISGAFEATAAVEIYDPASATWSTAGFLSTARGEHTATLLPTGEVLVVGGRFENTFISSVEIYDPVLDMWFSGDALNGGRRGHTATLLPSGEVLVLGGLGPGAVVYDPVTRGWTTGTAMMASRSEHTATLLPNGLILVTGGVTGGTIHTSAELYDPQNGVSTFVAPMTEARRGHRAALLPNGNVAVIGGSDGVDVLSSIELYDPQTNTWSMLTPLSTARNDHAATLLSNGELLIAAGGNASAEILSVVGGTWRSTTSLTTIRRWHTATLLPTGQVLVVDGWARTASAEIYDPIAETWSSTSMVDARYSHTATLLPSGNVLVTGGGSDETPTQTLDHAEVYDGSTGAWGAVAPMQIPRQDHTATLLASGRVLITGGKRDDTFLEGTLTDATIYDPVNNTWSTTASMNTQRLNHAATLLPSGRILITGGFLQYLALSSTEIYDPTTETWTLAGTMTVARAGHTSTLLPSGKVLIIGRGPGDPAVNAEIYDPESAAWSVAASPLIPRAQHAATLLSSGKVLVTGGNDADRNPVLMAEIYDPITDTWSPAGTLAEDRLGHTSTLLHSGEVLIVGSGVTTSRTAEIFSPSGAATARRPVIQEFPDELRYGTPATITGMLFRGDSETGDGTMQSSSAAFPMIQLLDIERERFFHLVADPRPNFFDDPMTLDISRLPDALSPGRYLLSVTAAGVPSVAAPVGVACHIHISAHPEDRTAALDGSVTFSVESAGGRTFQWQKDGVDIPGAVGASYTTPPINAADSGARYRVVITNGCTLRESAEATLAVEDTTGPTVDVISPAGGEFWTLSDINETQEKLITWSMSDNVRICDVQVSLIYSDDGGLTFSEVGDEGGLPAHFPAPESCPHPGSLATSTVYTVPTTPPSGTAGSLYKIRVEATDFSGTELSGNITHSESQNPFFIVQPNPQNIRTLIVTNLARMQDPLIQGISAEQAAALELKLRELAGHPRVEGLVVDLGLVSELDSPYAAWDAAPQLANELLFATGGIHDYLLGLLSIYTGTEYLIIVGDDRIIPMARIDDETVLLLESTYPAGGDLTAASTVGHALANDKYLSDDPLATLGPLRPADFTADALPILPDLALGRLVENPEEIISAISVFISQDGVLDLTRRDPVTGHKVLVTGYDFLVDSARNIRRHWNGVLGLVDDDMANAPVNGQLISRTWGANSVTTRIDALRQRLDGFGIEPYTLASLNGHATHYEEGVPGASRFEIAGLPTPDIYGTDFCASPSAGPLDLAGTAIYAVGCHGGLPVPGSCFDDADHSLDLPQTFLARGVQAYIANTGYGWGLLHGVGYSERLVEIFTGEIAHAGTVVLGNAVVEAKLRYFLEVPRLDPYVEKTSMQWAFYGFPMYAVRTGIAETTSRAGTARSAPAVHEIPNRMVDDGVIVKRRIPFEKAAPPSRVIRLETHIDLSAADLYEKVNSEGDPETLPGCGDPDGCYYTLNGLSTGLSDLPVQPYFIFESAISGTVQHGVLWKGGSYTEEGGWIPVIAQPSSNQQEDLSDHGSTPRKVFILPKGPRRGRRASLAGADACGPGPGEVSSVVISTGEAVKDQAGDLNYNVERIFREVDIEVFYFHDPLDPAADCDRLGPDIGNPPLNGRYHAHSGDRIEWAVPANDIAGVWRVVVVWNDNSLMAGRGRWTALELEDDGTGTWRGALEIAGAERLTYMIQAVDRRGNVSWLDFTTTRPPESGASLGLANPIDVTIGGVGLIFADGFESGDTSRW